MNTRRPALFLDRDGILNEIVLRGEVVSSPRSLAEFQPRMEARVLIQAARQHAWRCVVITNQPDIARQLLRVEDLEAMHEQLRGLFGLDAFFVCGSDDESDPRRKPNPGMLLEAAEGMNIDLRTSWFVGDSWKDVAAGSAAGTHTAFLRTSYNQTQNPPADCIFCSLEEMAAHIFRRHPAQ